MQIAGAAGIVGFALIWHIWWLAIVGSLGMVVALIARCYAKNVDYYVEPQEVAEIERAHLASVATVKEEAL